MTDVPDWLRPGGEHEWLFTFWADEDQSFTPTVGEQFVNTPELGTHRQHYPGGPLVPLFSTPASAKWSIEGRDVRLVTRGTAISYGVMRFADIGITVCIETDHPAEDGTEVEFDGVLELDSHGTEEGDRFEVIAVGRWDDGNLVPVRAAVHEERMTWYFVRARSAGTKRPPN